MLLLSKRNITSAQLHWLSGVRGGDPRSSGGAVGTKIRCGGVAGGGPGSAPGARAEGSEDAEGGEQRRSWRQCCIVGGNAIGGDNAEGGARGGVRLRSLGDLFGDGESKIKSHDLGGGRDMQTTMCKNVFIC